MANTIAPIPVKLDFTRPLDVLFHCHQKIAANLEALRRATDELRAGNYAEFTPIFVTVDSVLSHFLSAGVKHTLDEEESLFPRLRNHRDAAVSEVFEVIEQLESQHQRAASIEDSLSRLLLKMAGGERPGPKTTNLFCELSESLYDLYRPHIQIENEFVFPAAREILSTEELLATGKEMLQRRRTLIRPSSPE